MENYTKSSHCTYDIKYHLVWIAILYGDCAEIMTEAMDDFSDDLLLRKKYVFSGIESFY